MLKNSILKIKNCQKALKIGGNSYFNAIFFNFSDSIVVKTFLKGGRLFKTILKI